MPKDYQQGKIYRLRCKTTGLQYIGHTTVSLKQRLMKHEGHKREYDKGSYKHYCSSFQIIENNDYTIELIENYPCETQAQLRQREDYFIKNETCVNMIGAYLTEEQKKEQATKWQRENPEQYKAYKAKWHKEHYVPSERILLTEEEKKARKKEWNENNKEYYEKYREEHKNRQAELGKDHYEKHKDDYKERAKAQREKIRNDPELLAKQREYKKLKAREYYAKKKALR